MSSTSTTHIRPERRKRPARTPLIQAPPQVRSRQPVSQWIAESMADGVDTLPGWSDLAVGNERTVPLPVYAGAQSFLGQVSTFRFALVIVAIGLALGLYVQHVYATQEVLSMVERARKEQLRLELKVNRLHGVLDQMMGPAAIYERARALGLEEDIMYGPAITWQQPE